MFTDTKFMSAKEKELTLKAWKTFLKHGLQRQHFTKRLYNHLIQHCSFIAHYNADGFYSYYFTNPNRTKDFIGQFDNDKGFQSVEYGGTGWLASEDYGDINAAMCVAVTEYKADIYANCQSEDFKRDTATIAAIMAKHQLGNVQAVEGGYRFS